MAAALRSIGAALGYASHTNPAVAAPGTIVDGDTLCLVFVVGTGSPPPPSVTLPSGFTNVTGSPFQVADAGGFTVDFYVATKTAASESGSYTVTHSSASSDGVILCVSDSSGVTLGSIAQANGSNGQSETANSVTSTTADALIAYLEHNWSLHGSSSVPSASAPTLTEQLDSASSLLYVATGVKSTAGATGSWTQSDNDNTGVAERWQTLVLAFEAGAVGPTIDTQPADQTVYEGNAASFSVSATTSGGTLHYQWKDDGSNVGTDSNSYSPTPALSDSGSYIMCDVSDDNGTTSTNSALLRVIPTARMAWLRA